MAEPTTGQEPTNPTPGAPAATSNIVSVQDTEPQVFDAAYVHSLRDEAANYRKKLRELEALRKADEDAKLSEQERQMRRLAELEQQAARVQDQEQAITEMLEARLRGMTPEARKAVDSLPAQDHLSKLRWLAANEGLLARKAAPTLDGGAGGTTRAGAPVSLTLEQEQAAKRMGISPERYAARLAEAKADKAKAAE